MCAPWQEPQISVIIPTFNRFDTLPKVLAALENQKCPLHSFQLIVLDDSSTDYTEKFLRQYARITPLNCHIQRTNFRNAGLARNRGVALAKAPVVLFMDDDVIPEPEVVQKHASFHALKENQNKVLMGRITMDESLQTFNQARLRIWNPSIIQKPYTIVEWNHYRASNTSMRKALFFKTGGFSSLLSLAEDTELAYRLRQINTEFYYDNTIRAIHHHPMGLDQYLDKAKGYGKSIAAWYQQEPDLRSELVKHYGVFAPEMPIVKRFKYIIRALFINRMTVPFVLFFGRKIRQPMLDLSEKLYKTLFRYYLRQSFRTNLQNSLSI